MYVNPTNYGIFLHLIVSVPDMKRVKSSLKEALVVSLQVDGSIEKYRVDNKFVPKVVSKDGTNKLLFSGIEEPTERKAKVMFL